MTAVERYRHSSLADDRHYMERLPDLARQFACSSMCPDTWRIITKPEKVWKSGREITVPADTPEQAERKVAELAIVGHSLAELDLHISLNVIPQVYVVHGRPGYMAQLQVLLADRFGCKLVPLDEESNGEHAVVRVTGKDRRWHRVSVTMAEAEAAGWPKRNSNYASMPDRMLMARACTKAISLHCPEAKMMLPPADQADLADIEAMLDADTETVEIAAVGAAPGVNRMVPPRSGTPDGHTIPEHLREPAIDEPVRAAILEQLSDLPGPVLDRIRAEAKALGIPNLKTDRVTRAHGALMVRLIDEAVADGGGDPVPASDQAPDGEPQTEPVGATCPPRTPGQHVVVEVHDGPVPDTFDFDRDDDGAPF